MPTWMEAEFSGATFNDERLNKRFKKIVEALCQNAGKSIHLACEDWSASKAAYRFFDNPKVEADEIIQPHFLATSRRVQALTESQDPVLVVQDTSYLNYSHHPSKEGMGRISRFEGDLGEDIHSSGLILHSALAITTSGVPLGFLNRKLWARTKPARLHLNTKKNFTSIPIEEKESYRWIESMRASHHLAKNPTKLVHVGDREADIFEFFYEAEELASHFLIRVRNQNRLLENGGKLIEEALSSPVQGTYELEVEDHKGCKRVATIEVRYVEVNVLPSVLKVRYGYTPVTASVITAEEINAPKGVEKVSWHLLTNLPVKSFDQAVEKIKWYGLRWQIEVYHRILKTGCQVLECRLRTEDRMQRYLALMTVVAWRIFWMSKVTRESPEIEVEEVLTEAEVEAIRLYRKSKGQILSKKTDANTWIRELARLGGFLARKSDGNPGALTLWRGYQRLQDIMLGMSMSEI